LPQQIYWACTLLDLNTEGSVQCYSKLHDIHLGYSQVSPMARDTVLGNRVDPRMSVLILLWKCLFLGAFVAPFSLKLPNFQNSDMFIRYTDCI